MTKGLVTVFGGSGFLGKHVVRALVKDGWRVRVPVRRPHTAQDLRVIGNVGQVQLMQANIRFRNSVIRAVEGSDAVVNLVSILFEAGKQKFGSVHMTGAENLALAAKMAGVTNFVQVSAIGADKDSSSEYAHTKGLAEEHLQNEIPSADIIRPSIMFGPEDSFFNRFAKMATMTPILPLIGGDTKFQPVYAGDVAQAIAKLLANGTSGETYELGGPSTYTFKQLMQFTLETIDRKRFLAPVPWVGATALGMVGEIIGALPFVKPFLTRDQVTNLKQDNVVSDNAKSFSDLGIDLETIEAIVPPYLERYRKHGQFHEKIS
ncbi:MAG: complex I NDUFA9 subunit family protein [Hellea sp.]|nr:complex I NDUFA9 subunit family protein [Hellea sp.]